MKCLKCGSEQWRPGTTPFHVTVGRRRFEADLAARVCGNCGEALVSHEELGRFEVGVAAELARTGAHSGEALKFMRKAIALRAVDLALLLDVAAESISRWETGDREAPRLAVATLGALVLDHAAGSTATLDRLRALRGERPKLANVVRVELPAAARG